MEKQSLSLLRPVVKKDRGVAGLTILLAVIAMIFIIGFLVMIFALIGASLSQGQFQSNSVSLLNVTTNRVVNTTGANANGYSSSSFQNCQLTVTAITNSSDQVLITSANYTVSGCLINGSTATAPFIHQLWKVNGTVTYETNSSATIAIYQTSSSIQTVTTWFPIIITITVMVVLILLTVIIIVAIRSSGLLQAGS